jgi:tetratricopeptide (TPR) repeat protein
MKHHVRLLTVCLMSLVPVVRGADSTVLKDELLSLLDDVRPAAVDANDRPAPEKAVEMVPAASEPNQTPAADKTSPISRESRPTAASDSSLEESRRMRQRFFMGQLEPIETLSAEQQEKNLEQLIRQLNALEPPKKEPAAALEPQKTEPNLIEAAAVSSEAGPNVPAEVKDPNTTVRPLLRQLEKAERVVDPLQLADTLFRQGYEAEAFMFYQQAAEQLAAEDIETLQWTLFQRANCCRRTDPAKAIGLYSELLSRFPGSRWSGAAKASQMTLEWTMNERLKPYLSAGDHADRQ